MTAIRPGHRAMVSAGAGVRTAWGEPFAASLVVLVGAWFAWRSWRLGLESAVGPGPGLLPFGVGVLLIVLALVWLARSLKSMRSARLVAGVGDRSSRRRVLLVLGGVVAYLVALPIVGFVMATLCFETLMVRFLACRSWWVAAGLAVVASFGLRYLFWDVLDVPLPKPQVDVLLDLGL